ncbi:hypothetical protein SAMN04487925_109129 [Bradyrhizobium sp. cf659]|nr:hypothetical protein SAMN04487925_109129 [Bradyrhizobium sp. cf659]
MPQQPTRASDYCPAPTPTGNVTAASSVPSATAPDTGFTCR